MVSVITAPEICLSMIDAFFTDYRWAVIEAKDAGSGFVCVILGKEGRFAEPTLGLD